MNDAPDPPSGSRTPTASPRSNQRAASPATPSPDTPSSDKPPVIPRTPPSATSAGPGGWRQTFSSLKNRGFLFLWLGMLAMMAGMQMQMLVRGYLVYDLTGSASLLGLVAAGSAVPMLALALFGGAIADRLERKRIIQVGQAAAATIPLAVGIAITTGVIEWYHLLIAGVVQGAVFSFMMPARQAIIPQLVGPRLLTNAMALNAAAMSATTLIAPAIAGGLYAVVGPDKVYYVIAGLGLIAVLLTTMVPKPASRKSAARARMTKEILAGLGYVRHNSLVMVLLLMALVTTLLAQPFRFLLPVFVVDVYHKGPESMGLLVAVMGAGSLVGSLVIAALGSWKRGLLLLLGSFLSGIALLLISVFPVYLVAAAIMVPLGLGDAARRSLNQALIMEETEDQYRGRVMSVFMMNFGLMPLGVLPAAFVADLLGGQWAIGILAVLLLIATSVIFASQKRLRNMA